MAGGRGAGKGSKPDQKQPSRRNTRSHDSHHHSDSEEEPDESHTCSCGSRSGSKDLTCTLLELVSKITDLLNSNTALTQANVELTKTVKELESNQKLLLDRIETLEQKSGDWQGPRPRPSSADIDAVTGLVSEEILARKEKELNVVIYGLPELETTNDTPASDADELTGVKDFLSADLQVQDPDLSRVFRMGKPRSPAERPRPLKVMFKCADKRSKTLDNAKNLGNLPDEHAHKKVFIRPDWTRMQREQDYHRRQANRNSRGNSNRQTTPTHDARTDNSQPFTAQPRGAHAGNSQQFPAR